MLMNLFRVGLDTAIETRLARDETEYLCFWGSEDLDDRDDNLHQQVAPSDDLPRTRC
jgi:hypothetical protein